MKPASARGFSRRGKRGRPKLLRPSLDTGTPELVMKRLRGETVEAIDLCLERALITPPQHRCGMHFRWLYTLRFGAPGVRAIDPTDLGGIVPSSEAPDWRKARETEYQKAAGLLHARGLYRIMANLCIYNESPGFLYRRPPLPADLEHLAKIAEGLDTLETLWRNHRR